MPDIFTSALDCANLLDGYPRGLNSAQAEDLDDPLPAMERAKKRSRSCRDSVRAW
jgi:hypothetical protein